MNNKGADQTARMCSLICTFAYAVNRFSHGVAQIKKRCELGSQTLIGEKTALRGLVWSKRKAFLDTGTSESLEGSNREEVGEEKSRYLSESLKTSNERDRK